MKLIIIIIIVLAIITSILAYLDIAIFTGIIAELFDGPIWETATSVIKEFGGFFTRILSNHYIALIIGTYIVFWLLRLFVDFLRSKKANSNAAKSESKKGE